MHRLAPGAMAITSGLLSDKRTRAAFAQAVADLATRLAFSGLTAEQFRNATSRDDLLEQDRFQLHHDRDARMIREGLSLWKPVFSSELLWRALPQRDAEPSVRLSDESHFRPPYFAVQSWTYLSALGGYGIALPAKAQRDQDSRKVLKTVFLANPCLIHPYLNDMVPRDPHSSMERFVTRHGRPRWPFWREVEGALDSFIFDLLLELDRSIPEARGNVIAYWRRTVDAVNSPAMDKLFTSFLRRLRAAAAQKHWVYCAKPKRRVPKPKKRVGGSRRISAATQESPAKALPWWSPRMAR